MSIVYKMGSSEDMNLEKVEIEVVFFFFFFCCFNKVNDVIKTFMLLKASNNIFVVNAGLPDDI